MDIRKFGFYFLIFIILVLAYQFTSIIYAFFPAIASACVLAYVFNPVYLRLWKMTKSRTGAAALIILIIFILILIPLLVIFITLRNQLAFLFREELYESIPPLIDGLNDFIRNTLGIEIPEQYLRDIRTNLVPEAINAIRAFMTAYAPRFLMGLTNLIISAFVTFFILFYLLKNSKSVIQTFRDYFPLSRRNTDILLSQLGKDTNILILAQLLISFIQGVLGGLGFWFFQVEGFVIWGFIMAIFSFLPAVGPFFIWLPIGLFLLVTGEYFNGLGVMIWGASVVSMIDNILRPKLTSLLGKLHPVTILLGVFIGIIEWGFVGIVIGPLIISVLITLIKMFREEYLVEESRDY